MADDQTTDAEVVKSESTEDELKKAQEVIEKNKQANLSACMREIQEVLAKYSCTLTANINVSNK
jgi:hypothetical protein